MSMYLQTIGQCPSEYTKHESSDLMESNLVFSLMVCCNRKVHGLGLIINVSPVMGTQFLYLPLTL